MTDDLGDEVWDEVRSTYNTLADTVERELRSLWRVAPVDSDTLHDRAPTVVSLLSTEYEGAEALQALRALLADNESDKYIRALGFHSAPSRNVTDRFWDLAHEVEKQEARTSRRWAERGTKLIAERIAQLNEPRPQVWISLSDHKSQLMLQVGHIQGAAAWRLLSLEVAVGGHLAYRFDQPADNDSAYGLFDYDKCNPIFLKWVSKRAPEIDVESSLERLIQVNATSGHALLRLGENEP